ncbi:uncharacterized protein LOC129732951 [Wyeomyia smithii]|uniref:uncharacterized protein LOC129732951 n=1 Tax=Wyeomyia smithii TaxID=174621 RepID=UPI002467E9F0|nr:uncharacterized protein LOC129732951 [Wyeomyia smithii]
MADQAARESLECHGLARIQGNLGNAGVKFEDFWYFKANIGELQCILPDLRDRMDFLRCLKYIVADKECQTNLPAPICAHESLLSICERSESGRKFLDIVNNNNESNICTPECRKYIKDAVVEYFLVLKNGKIFASDFTQMAQIICNQLPREDPRTWYTPRTQNQAAGGLLYTRYKYVQQHDTRFKKSVKHPSAAAPVIEQQTGNTTQFQDHWNLLSVDERDQCLDNCGLQTNSSQLC